MLFKSNTLEELNLLLQFNDSQEQGIKVHSDAREQVVQACQSLFNKKLVTQKDGGYLTDAGLEALTLGQKLAKIFGD